MVDFISLASSPLSDSLKCFICKNYLSYFPISICSNNESICGRCTKPKDLMSYKNEAFEEVCQHFKFPCRFKNVGCPEEFLPKDTPEHEKKCLFRLLECIINKPEKCQWQGSLPDLLEHCKKRHSDLILKNHQFEMDPTDAEERDNLILLENNVLLVLRRKYSPKNKKLKFVFCFSDIGTSFKPYFCQLSVTNDKTSVLFDLESTEEVLKVNEVSLQSLYSDDDPDTFLLKIILPEDKNVTSVQHNEINSQLLRFLKCLRCGDIVMPPAFHCARNMNVLCSFCKDIHHLDCKFCNGTPVSSVSFGEILRFVLYPCKYESSGCKFSSKRDSLEKHQLSCEHKPTHCPFLMDVENGCLWSEITRDLPSHILNAHEDRIHSTEEIYELRSDELNTYLIRFSDHLFSLLCGFENGGERCMWALQRIGDFDTNYKFEVEIVDEASGLGILVGTGCSLYTKMHEDDFCYIYKDQIECWKEDEELRLQFKLRILKMM